MSLNIPDRIMRLTKSWTASVEIDVAKLGKLQLSSLKKMITTGIIKGRSVPASIARSLRDEHGLPMLHIDSDNLSWTKLASDCAFYEKLTVALVQHKLTPRPELNDRYYYKPDIDGAMLIAEKKEPTASVWVPGINKAHFQKLKLGSNDALDAWVASLTAGEITSIPFNYS